MRLNPVVLGFYGTLFGAVVWLCGHGQCSAERAGPAACPALRGGVARLLGGVGGAAGVLQQPADPWRRVVGGRNLTALAAAGVLWAVGQLFQAAFLGRIAEFFSSADLSESVAGFRRLNWCMAPTAPLVGLGLFADWTPAAAARAGGCAAGVRSRAVRPAELPLSDAVGRQTAGGRRPGRSTAQPSSRCRFAAPASRSRPRASPPAARPATPATRPPRGRAGFGEM